MHHGQCLLQELKSSAGGHDHRFEIIIPGFEGYVLRPIPTRRRFLNIVDVSCLTEWRNLHVNAFLTEFTATNSRTMDWLSETVHHDSSRILFMIENESRDRLGYMGLAFIDWSNCYGEADAIVRGKSTEKGLMSTALKSLIGWAKNQLGITSIGLRVLSDNPALLFYKKLGFIETNRFPLKKQANGDLVRWIEDETISESNRYLVHHVWPN